MYGDYVTGKVWAARFSKEDRPTWQQELAQSSIKVICFGESRDQELYIADYVSGGLFQLRKRSAVVANRSFPKLLSQTGLFRSVADHQPAAGVYTYDVNAKPWEDNTIAERWVAIPDMNRLGIHDATDRQRGILKGEWSFPTGTVFVKTISTVSPPQRIETQLLHLSEDGWRGYSYCWNDSQTDAELVPASGKEIRMPVHAGKQEGPSIYKIPGRNDCLLCHTPQGGFVYGFRPSQLDKQVQWKDQAINQLKLFESLELFEKRSKKSTRLVDPYAASEPLDDRARSYLHVNCSHCHQRGGGGTAHLELGRQLAADRMHMLNERPTQGTFGIFDAKVVAGGDPYRSVLYYRISKLGPGRMPHYGAQTVDRKGVSLIHKWINSLEAAESDSAVTRIRTQQTKQLDRTVGWRVQCFRGPEAPAANTQRVNDVGRRHSSTASRSGSA